ncbi:bifunctional folylpolyglutamate synthase/dihydrofolate synthase [Lachnospira multipara]|uniref:bifunctional folylpolyglutamate synthase/dihydrofolate synthase n=1 Tax=Lachnospira multipara TaxID=28051 RepID=UPI000484E14B|nr:Mur ligase family protein [Lachnospira multipara]
MFFGSYKEVVSYLDNLGQFAKGTGVERERILLDRLNKIDMNLKFIHVAGTNGKGSTCAFLANSLECLGFKVGLFTSPHLVKINERIKINGEDISDEDFYNCFNRVASVITDGDFAYFDLIMATAIVYYTQKCVDIIVLETGLGGKLDASNAIKSPICSIITGVSLEHTAILGDTIEKIASEKAGIIKPKVPVIFNANDKKVAEVVNNRFKEVNKDSCYNKIFPVTKEMYHIKEISLGNIDFFIDNDYYRNDCFFVGSNGIYQVLNASLCLMALAVLAKDGLINFNKDAIKEGIKKTKWPGRMELVKRNVFIDGGHNPEGVSRFIESARSILELDKKRAKLLFSVVSDKDYTHMIKDLVESNCFDEYIITVVGGLRKVSADVIKDIFNRFTDKKVMVIDDAGEFIDTYEGSDYLFAVGSLYLVGEIKRTIN